MIPPLFLTRILFLCFLWWVFEWENLSATFLIFGKFIIECSFQTCMKLLCIFVREDPGLWTVNPQFSLLKDSFAFVSLSLWLMNKSFQPCVAELCLLILWWQWTYILNGVGNIQCWFNVCLSLSSFMYLALFLSSTLSTLYETWGLFWVLMTWNELK